MQEIKFRSDLFKKVKNGTKSVTIRKGLKPYMLGFCIGIDDEEKDSLFLYIWALSVNIFSHVPEELLLHDFGHTDRDKALKELQEFYPDLTMDDAVTCIAFGRYNVKERESITKSVTDDPFVSSM